jgi:hypothetical protein
MVPCPINKGMPTKGILPNNCMERSNWEGLLLWANYYRKLFLIRILINRRAKN